LDTEYIMSCICAWQRTTILLQRSARQAPWPSLYLDAFGEEVSLPFVKFTDIQNIIIFSLQLRSW